MSTEMSSLSIPEAASHYYVSTKTIRRWIKARRLKAQRVNGQWYVQPDMDKMSNVSTPNVHPVHPPACGGNKGGAPDTTGQLHQMQSEITHLREALHKRDTQIEQLNAILAMQTQQNTQLIAQLPPPRQTIAERITKLFAKLSTQKA